MADLASEASRIADVIAKSRTKYLSKLRSALHFEKSKRLKVEKPEPTVKQEKENGAIRNAVALALSSPHKPEPAGPKHEPAPVKQEQSEAPMVDKRGPHTTSPKKPSPKKTKSHPLADWDYKEKKAKLCWKGELLWADEVSPAEPNNMQSFVMAHFREKGLHVRVAGIWWEIVLVGRTPVAAEAVAVKASKVFRTASA